MHNIQLKRSSDEISTAEIDNLGIIALARLNNLLGVDILNFNYKDLFNFYHDVIHNPKKYYEFAQWLSLRFGMFIERNSPMKIWVGGTIKFINRGDEKLESSLSKTYLAICEYADTGVISPRKISAVLYYVNKMVN